MADLPTPETDNAPKFYFGDNRPSMETECVSADFARNLERQRNELLGQLQNLKEWATNWDSPFIDDPEFSWEPIDAAIAKVKGAQP